MVGFALWRHLIRGGRERRSGSPTWLRWQHVRHYGQLAVTGNTASGPGGELRRRIDYSMGQAYVLATSITRS